MNQLTAYQQGWGEGFADALSTIRGETLVKGTSPYTGPIPDELKAWIDSILDRIPNLRLKP